MKRLGFMLLLLLALGLCTSVLVAWAGALVDRSAWPDTLLTRNPTGTRTEMRGWLVEAGRDRTLTWRTFAALDLYVEPPDLDACTELPPWSIGHALPDQPGPFVPARERTQDIAWEVSAGWPMRCVRATRTAGPAEFALPGEFVRGGVAAMAFDWPFAHAAVPEPSRPGVEPWPLARQPAIVPARPLLGGLLVNTLVYALAWDLALSPLLALRVLRRWRRLKHGRCIQCGHSVAGLPDGAPCPECGRGVHERTTIAELIAAPAWVRAAALALFVVAGASGGLLVHRWIAVPRLPALHHAAAAGDAKQIERLLAAGADPNAMHGHSNNSRIILDDTTALTRAAALGHAEAVEALLAGGARADTGSYATNPIAVAMWYGHEAIAERLFAELPLTSLPRGFAAVFPYASDAMRARILGHLGWSATDRVGAAAAALRAHDLAAAGLIVERGLDRTRHPGLDLLLVAVRADADAWREPWKRDTGITRWVIGLGLDHALFGVGEAMREAIMSGCSPSLDALVAAYPDRFVFARSLTAEDLATAALRGGPDMLARLVGLGVDPNAVPRPHFNALWYAACWIEPEALEALLDYGLDPTLTANDQTLRHWLLFHRDQALADPEAYPDHPFVVNADAFAHIVDLLEAAEAKWHVREGSAGDPSAPGGP